jgi:SLOG in TRPM, prokaryote/SMODS and SLOG-associating 2TM effector domain 1/SMODS and SLOG-associating 2TM effector domain 3
VADPGSGATVKSVEAGEDDDAAGLVAALGLAQGARPAILVCGGAKLGATEEQRCREVLGPSIRDAAFAAAAVVVDGGTDAGVMRVVGQARAAGPSAMRVLVGVAPRSKVALPGEDRDGVAVEPHHTHAVLTPGTEFGAERGTLFDITAVLAGSHNIAVVLAGGGREARNEALEAVRRGWPLLVLAGTGGTADDVAAPRNGQPPDAEIERLAAYDQTTVVGESGPGLAAHLTWTLIRDRPVLKSAWCRYAAYEDAAGAMQKRYFRVLTALLALGLLASGAAAFQHDLAEAGATAGAVARWCAIVLPTVLVLLVGWNRQRALGKQWVVLRAAAEAIKGEMFRYRTGTSPYDGDGVREHELQDRVNLIHRQVISTEVATTSLSQPPESAPPPNLYEEGLGDLDVARYASRRIDDQRVWYRRKVHQKARARDALCAAAFAVGILGTGLAAAGIVPAVAVTTALSTGLAGLLAARQYGEDVIYYNRTAAELDGEFAQATRPNADGLTKIVLRTEEILVAELGEWAQRMARALAREERRQADLVHQHESQD